MGAAAIPVVTAVITAAATVYSQVQASNAAKAQARYQQRIAENNKITADRAAEDARARGEADAQRRQQELSVLEGRQRAALAANGVVVDEGSALEIVEQTAARSELDALTIRSNAEREALGFEAQGTNFAQTAQFNALRAEQESEALPFEVGGTLLTSSANVASKWNSFT